MSHYIFEMIPEGLIIIFQSSLKLENSWKINLKNIFLITSEQNRILKHDTPHCYRFFPLSHNYFSQYLVGEI